jgi:hypothetical protein
MLLREFANINVPELVWMQNGSIVVAMECLVSCHVAALTVKLMRIATFLERKKCFTLRVRGMYRSYLCVTFVATFSPSSFTSSTYLDLPHFKHFCSLPCSFQKSMRLSWQTSIFLYSIPRPSSNFLGLIHVFGHLVTCRKNLANQIHELFVTVNKECKLGLD